MSGLKNTFKRGWSMSQGQGWSTSGERAAKRQADEKARLDAIYGSAAMPDEDEIGRRQRRKQAARKGSRAETVLTDTLG